MTGPGVGLSFRIEKDLAEHFVPICRTLSCVARVRWASADVRVLSQQFAVVLNLGAQIAAELIWRIAD